MGPAHNTGVPAANLSRSLVLMCSETALMLAARSGVVAIVKGLLARGAAVQATNTWGDAALAYSAEKGFTEIIKELILAGADVDAVDKHG